MYKIKLPLRYLFKRKISYVAIAAVALCVFIVLIVMTVHSGLVQQYKDKNHDFYSDTIISTDSMVGFPYYQQFIEKLHDQPYVQAASPVVITIGSLTRSGYDENIAVEIMGIDLSSHIKVSNFEDTLFYHKQNPLDAFVPPYDPNRPGFIPGITMMSARDQQGNYDLPQTPMQMSVEISCVPLTARGAMQRADIDYVNTKTFRFSDTAQTNLANVDARTVFITHSDAQALCGMSGDTPRTNAIFINFIPGTNIEQAAAKVSSLWNDFKLLNADKPNANLLDTPTVQTWKQYRRETIAWMEKEQIMLTMLFIMVAITTVFIVFVIFYMIINHKIKDVGILRSIGVSSGSVMQIFMAFAGLIAVIGTAIGSFFGWLFLHIINDLENLLLELFNFQVFDRTVFAIGALPNDIPPMLLLTIAASAILACLLGAFIPAYKAAAKKPVDTLKVTPL